MLDINFLKQQQEELESRGGDSTYFNVRKLKGETDIRLMLPTERMGKLYYFEKITHWINGQPFVSPETFGEECPISEIVVGIKGGSDTSLKAMVSKGSKYSKKSTFLIPCMILQNVVMDAKGKVTAFDVADNAPKILEVPITVIKMINSIITSRAYQNESGMSILDPIHGRNLIFNKKGAGMDTEYTVLAWPTAHAIDEGFYENTICPVESVEGDIKSNEELQEAIKVYLFGSNVPDQAPADKPKRSFKMEKG